VNQFTVISLTHRQIGLEQLGKLHVQQEEQHERFNPLLSAFSMNEFMFLSTCNRVEFFFRTPLEVTTDFIERFMEAAYPERSKESVRLNQENRRVYKGLDAVRHMFHVASSLDSLIVGEREIITQVRKAHDHYYKAGLSNDFIRIAITKAVETAKAIYTQTEIATKPISIVNLGYKKLLERDLTDDQSVIFIGAGTTIEAIAGNMKSLKAKEVKVFNRTKSKAVSLAEALNGNGYSLGELEQRAGDFDVIITCTGSESAIITPELFQKIRSGKNSSVTILDLAVPADIDPSVAQLQNVDYISIDDLRLEAKANLKEREKEIFHCENLVEARLIDFEDSFRSRRLELAMSQVPRIMKDIKVNALENKFAKSIEAMNPEDQAVLMDIVNYLEKKYISLPMKMAKQVVLNKDLKDSIID
jgi:glutamyl-tRNA reductase